jgi:dihydroorotate dehydrogenase
VVAVNVPQVAGTWSFCGLPVGSPLGVPAGPLLNGRWVLYYAALGFEVLTYKTVRSVARECYPLPNLQPIVSGQLSAPHSQLVACEEMHGSWAVSFGMPSKGPEFWRRDIESTRRQLPAGKILSVSVVGTVQPDWSLDDLADDYARCARWALDSGADCIETNFSCPNVTTCDGQLYQNENSAALVAARVRDAIGNAPYIIKIGHLMDRGQAGRLLDAVAAQATALAMTNSVAAVVRESNGRPLFDGQPRGVCGDATREASLAQTKLFAELIAERGLSSKHSKIKLIGVGGASTAGHVRDYLASGAESVHIATAAMTDPLIACRIRADLVAN